MQSQSVFIDDLELLAVMLRLHEADQLHHQSGDQLLTALGGMPSVDASRTAFVRLLHIAEEDELISFELIPPRSMPPPRPDEYAYLQYLRNFRLRTKGIDRARGQRIVDPPPVRGEDDGRRIPLRVLEKVSDAIGAELRGEEARSFLLDAGVPDEHCPEEPDSSPASYVRAVLIALMERGASGRRVVRQVIGRWIADELEVGPSIEQRATLIGDLARAGWKPKGSTLVIAPPRKFPRYEPAALSSTAAVTDSSAVHDPERARKVMVVYGRDEAATRALFDLLRAVDLQPQEWTQLIRETGSGAPYTGQVLDRALEIVQAVVVLFTPDDQARLHPAFPGASDTSTESELRGQPRPNVLYEAGLAFGRHPDRTILIEVGDLRGLSDLSGRHTVRLDKGAEALHDLVERLRTAGCAVNTSGNQWLDTSRFVARATLATSATDERAADTNESDALVRLVQEILDAALGQPAAPDVAAELARRLRNLSDVVGGDELFADLPGRRMSTRQQKRVSYDLFEHRVLARNPDGRGFVRGEYSGDGVPSRR